MKYRIFSLLLAVCFLMGAAVPVMASEVVETKYNYTPLPGYYFFYQGTSNQFGGSIPASGGSFQHSVTITDTTNTHFNLKLNADVSGQFDYLSFVVFCQTDNITSVAGYLENASGSIATECQYSVTSASDLIGLNGTYAVTVLVDCSGFSGDVNVEISGHLGGKTFNDFSIYITGYSVSSYSGVLVDYWDDTLELLRQILAELQKSNGFLSDIKTSLAGFRSDLVYWVQEVYSAIQLNFLTLTNFLNGFKSSVESGFSNVITSINTWGQNIMDALVGEHYTSDDEFATEAADIVEVNDAYSEYLNEATPDISLNDYDPLGTFEASGVTFNSIGPVLLNLFSNNVLLDVILLSLTFSLVGYVLYGKR